MKYLSRLHCLFLLQSEGESAVLVAGDPEKLHMDKCDREGGIRYHPNQIIKAVSRRIVSASMA